MQELIVLQVYAMHHNHSENFQDQLVRLKRSKPEMALYPIQLHRLDKLPVLSLIQHNLQNHYHWMLEWTV